MSEFGTASLFGYGVTTIIWFVALAVVGAIVWRGRRSNYVAGTTIVLQRFQVNEDPSARIAVEITGRLSGIVSWILTLLKLQSDFELIVTDSEATFRSGSLSGIQYTYVPLGKISASVCGYQRSILAFGFAILFSVGFVLNFLSGLSGNSSDMAVAFGFLVFAAIAALVYYLSKRIMISFETMHRHGFAFKRSVIENVSVDLPEALRAIALINARILASQAGYTQQASGGAPPSPAMAPTIPGSQGPWRCPKCSSINPIDVRFCENCGVAL